MAWRDAIVASRNACLHDPEREACGYIEQNTIITCVNVSREPGRFAFSSEEAWLAYEALEAGRLQGIWHSHPLGHKEPSAEDWINHPLSVPMYIVVLMGYTEACVMRFTDEDRPVMRAMG
jgi:proteasome lid subunit RPN8/RPN11